MTSAAEALSRLRRLGVPVVRTSDAAAALGQTSFAASQTLRRLGAAGLVQPLRHGVWWVAGEIDPLLLPEQLTHPMPSYVSLLSALHLRGAIEQIPSIVYAVSLARSQRIETSAGTFSIHHIGAELFGGFEETRAGVKLASVEKALFDVAYLSGGRSRLFAHLPELELPRRFRRTALTHWLRTIADPRRRASTRARLVSWVGPLRMAA